MKRQQILRSDRNLKNKVFVMETSKEINAYQ